MANPFRNEVEVKIGSTTYKLRPTFGAMAEMENHFDRSLGEVLLAMSQGKTRLYDLKTIITFGCKGADTEVNEDQLEQDLIEAGITKVVTAVAPFLTQAFSGAPIAAAEKKVVTLTPNPKK